MEEAIEQPKDLNFNIDMSNNSNNKATIQSKQNQVSQENLGETRKINSQKQQQMSSSDKINITNFLSEVNPNICHKKKVSSK